MPHNVPSCKRWTDEGIKREVIMTKENIKGLKAGIKSLVRELLSPLLNSENTEGVSNDTDESGVLHGVGDSHASEPTDKDNQSFDDGTLWKVIVQNY